MITTRVCPECGNERLAHFTSLRKKYCVECYHWMDWELSRGQKPLVGPARQVRKAKSDELW